MTKKIAVIGAGFGGMSVATYLAKYGHDVTVFEKNEQPGGRARVVKRKGFTFDLGPSWYMMPDVFDEFFADFGKKTADFYNLVPLDPSYKVFDKLGDIEISNIVKTKQTFERIHSGDGLGLEKLLQKTGAEYKDVRKNLLKKDWLNLIQVVDPMVLKFLAKPSLITSYDKRIRKYIQDERLVRILEFMTVFMGGSPKNIPGMYTLLSYVDMGLKIWYPMGGFSSVAHGFETLAISQGVKFRYNCAITNIDKDKKEMILTDQTGESGSYDFVVANADYHHVETGLLEPSLRAIAPRKWDKKVMSPSGLMICLGVNKKVKNLSHHNLFFDVDWDSHFGSVFENRKWTQEPLIYVCVPSATDKSVAPDGMENVFILAPQASDSDPSQKIVDLTTEKIIQRIEKVSGAFAESIVVKEAFSNSYFSETFNAYKGNAFGLAHTLRQSALFRPPIRSKKCPSLFYVGQYTNPGTGVPMVVLSGKVVADTISKQIESR